jgi:hypothetical protein
VVWEGQEPQFLTLQNNRGGEREKASGKSEIELGSEMDETRKKMVARKQMRMRRVRRV